jgi:hypothetical protein
MKHRSVPVSLNHKKAHTRSEVKPMVAAAGIWKKKRADLKTKRNSLFEAYTKHPHEYHLAREIKEIDDEIAECTQHVEQERRAEQRTISPAGKLATTHK